MDKRLILLVMLLASAVAAGAQTERRIYTKAEQESAQKREVEKRIEAIQDSIRSVEAFTALEQLDFVLKANRLSFKRGETAFVTSNTNFVSLSDDKAVIQIAPFYGGGPNGVGGITLEGRASNIKLKTDKKGNVILTMSVSGTGLSAMVDISLPKNSYMASVTVNPNFHSNRVTLYGVLLPSGKSDVFKGRAL
ncbi:DUF4251 domain-containing protein [Phocaeicola vulgatus]|uniref:DUF4251 domain-containing protein n=1 Tax=Phocaeicola vulgatus TaxID=821 RepID=UPI00356965F0